MLYILNEPIKNLHYYNIHSSVFMRLLLNSYIKKLKARKNILFNLYLT